MHLRTYQELLNEQLQEQYPRDEIQHFFYLLVEHYLNENRFILAKNPEYEIPLDCLKPLEQALIDLKAHRPIQYIMGVWDFLDLSLILQPGVLIPRPETEDMVAYITSLEFVQSPKSIADLGTGSGCIGLSLKKHFPEAEVHLYDVSHQALKIASENAKKNHLEVTTHCKDLLHVSTLNNTFDLIVSNPPYVCESEKELMRPNVLEHEPDLALFVLDDDPLLFYRKIAKLAIRDLNKGGKLFYEINERFPEETQIMLSDMGFQQVKVHLDRFGKPRIVEACKP